MSKIHKIHRTNLVDLDRKTHQSHLCTGPHHRIYHKSLYIQTALTNERCDTQTGTGCSPDLYALPHCTMLNYIGKPVIHKYHTFIITVLYTT